MKTVTGKPAITKGYIRRVDNPGVVQQMRRNLEQSGVQSPDITVGNDPRSYLRSLEPGTVVVVNSLFDLSSDISGILETIREALSRGISVQSLRDGYPMTKAAKAAGCSYPSFRYWYQNNFTDKN